MLNAVDRGLAHLSSQFVLFRNIVDDFRMMLFYLENLEKMQYFPLLAFYAQAQGIHPSHEREEVLLSNGLQ